MNIKKKIFFIMLITSLIFIPRIVKAEVMDTKKLLQKYNLVVLNGILVNPIDVEGAVLVNGNIISGTSSTFGTNAGNIKSFISGSIDSNVTTPSEIDTDASKYDFNAMYLNVLNESRTLADSAENHINNAKIEINKPGNYVIHNTSLFNAQEYNPSYNGNHVKHNTILINNYDPNSLYVFNYYDEIVDNISSVDVIKTGESTAIHLVDLIESGEYTGNIIFNCPNAKSITINLSYPMQNFYYDNPEIYGFSGNLVAPKAFVTFSYNYGGRDGSMKNFFYGTIIAKAISFSYDKFYIKKSGYNINKDIITSGTTRCYVEEPVDYDDDSYDRDYSISDLLLNYSLVTLGHKELDSKSKLLNYGNNPGSIRLFHITGPALISGSLYGGWNSNVFEKTAFDLESNKVTESYIRGDVNVNNTSPTESRSVIQPWDNMLNDGLLYIYKKNRLWVGSQNGVFASGRSVGVGNYSGVKDNYINFDRLYNNIVAEQSGIDEGDKVKSSNGVAHIPIGGNYVIDDISDINKIVFDNYEDNSKMITIVTIKNSGDINFPEINKDKGGYKGIITNDYYGKEQATHLYERDTFVTNDSYYGNIIFNVPNATYIKLKENVPFAGHLIAPNADVETEETHFAGCFIVNSIYGEGNTEAHFYPLSAYDNCECSVGEQVPDGLQARFNELRLERLLGGSKSIVEKTIVGDQVQYKNDTDQLNEIIDNCPLKRQSSSLIDNLINNPPTYGTIGSVVLIIIGLVIGFGIYKKKKAV